MHYFPTLPCLIAKILKIPITVHCVNVYNKHNCPQVSEAHIGHDDENLRNVTLFVTKRARFFLRSFSWGNPKRNPKRRPPLRTTSQAPSLDNLNCLDMSMIFVHSSFRGKHSLQIRVKHDTRSTEVRKLGDASRMTRNRNACRDPDESSTLLQAGLRSEEFLSQNSVLLGGSSDPLRTRRAQDADAAF
ncbi:hypothetical protein G5I_06657 [Acromyrmex echinatior]|uniref:Uncharacterized protein n=1 Tax=Acromyrmex echinatior TaxID=103372 RepID=F4WLM9_ACREC|nr:hypothetical protein G5I_06657 [Acromyrmex echinatior]